MSRSLYLETRLFPNLEQGETVRIEAGGAQYTFTVCERVDRHFLRLYLEEIKCLPTNREA